MITIKQLKSVNTFDQLVDLKIGSIISEVGPRGGYLGFTGEDVAKHFKMFGDFLPKNFGAYCNYLGGGVRGQICKSRYSPLLSPKQMSLLNELGNACVRVYESLEDEYGLNDELDGDGEVNWESMATRASRKAGIVSAY